MESESVKIAGRKVPAADWDATPESIKLVTEDYHAMVIGLTQRVSALEEKLNKNSKNSSIPPSKKGFGENRSKNRRSKIRKPQNRELKIPSRKKSSTHLTNVKQYMKKNRQHVRSVVNIDKATDK